MYSVVIIDDEKLVINSLALGFDWQETNFEIIETFQSSMEARKKVPLLKPDLILCDIKMPHLSGLELMAQIQSELPLTRFIFITGYEDFTYAKQAIRLGASDYIVKPVEDDELIESLNQVEQFFIGIQKQFSAAFEYAVRARDSKNIRLLRELLEHSLNLHFPCTFATSLNSIGAELKDKLLFYEWELEDHLFFYVIPDPAQLKDPEIIKKLQKLLIKKNILGFKYIDINNWDDFPSALYKLSEEVYSFFLSPTNVLDDFEIILDVSKEKSAFLTLLEKARLDNSLKDFIDVLTRSDELYPVSERTIEETLKIYDLTMSILDRINNEDPRHPLYTPPQILTQYDNFNQLISKLLELCYECLVSQNDTAVLKQIKNDTFRNILNYINQNFTEEISFTEISKLFSINPSYLSQIFKRELGITFTQYLTETRIKYAKDLLSTTGLTISEISEKVGFNQYIYFSKVFKKTVGISPSSYRKTTSN